MKMQYLALVVVTMVVIVTADVTIVKLRRRHRRSWLMGTKPPGTVCAFNPCQITDFCEGGRRCDFNNNTCLHNCVCTEDSDHEMCVTQTDRPETMTTRVDDGNNLTTTASPQNVTENEDTDNITLAPTTRGRSCPAGFPCKHGDCVPSGDFGFSCDCDTGWSGIFCDSQGPRQTCDDSDCQANEKCVVVSSTLKTCVPGLIVAPDNNGTDPVTNGNTSNACSPDYVMRNLSERQCPTKKLLCVYGVCVEQTSESPFCSCDRGATGLLCQDKCCQDCGENGECRNIDNEESCICHFNYTGPQCNVIKKSEDPAPPEEKTWYLWVVGVCAVVLFFLVVLLVVVPYVMWRHRVIMVMKIVHYFQGYEDDDEREWDAFVSYKSDEKDESFVVHTLYPKLEKELGFKLHLHFRDFIPGETIANNIIRAVSGSRRTILIISPKFVTSEFTKFEYQVAQHEMLKLKHRIIPILLEDISQCSDMDPNLKQIIGSVTYIEWPGENDEKKLEKFWKRVKLSLPKKRSDDSQTKITSSSSPEQIEISVVDENSTRINAIDSPSMKIEEEKSTPTTAYDNMVYEDEEVYDTINDDDVKTQVMRKNVINSSNGGVIQNGGPISDVTACV